MTNYRCGASTLSLVWSHWHHLVVPFHTRHCCSLTARMTRPVASLSSHPLQCLSTRTDTDFDHDKLQEKINYYCLYNPSPLSLQTLADFGVKQACQSTSFSFLRKELPVRLANIMKEISLLPDTLLEMSSVKQVQTWYEQSMMDVLRFEHSDSESNSVLDEFAETMVTIRNRHSNVVETMAHGVIEMKETYGDVVDNATESSVQYFLDRFYMSRISIRMLINQHALLFGNTQPTHPTHIGAIDPRCDMAAVLRDAYCSAKFLCDQYYLCSPDLELDVLNSVDTKSKVVEVTYVPSHLYHMLFELFKNSMRAVVEHWGTAADDYPPIRAKIVLGKEDITIKMSDCGGGIPRSDIDLLFKYMYSTAPQPPPRTGSNIAPLAGYGYGLPLSRLYARYFQGDLQLISLEGYGTDAVIWLKAISSEASELLPVFNKTSSKHYRHTTPTGDWSSHTPIMFNT